MRSFAPAGERLVLFMQGNNDGLAKGPVGIHISGGLLSYQFWAGDRTACKGSIPLAASKQPPLLGWMAPENYGALCARMGNRGMVPGGVVLTVPDGCGIRDYVRISRAADAAGIPLLRIISETTAAALVRTAELMNTGEEQMLLVAAVGGGVRSLAGFSLGDGVLQKLERILSFEAEESGDEAAEELRFLTGLQRYSDWKRYDAILIAGDQPRQGRYEALLREELREAAGRAAPEDRPRLERMAFRAGETSLFPLGGAIWAAYLMGVVSNLLVLDTVPAALYLSHGGESRRLLPPDTTLPYRHTAALFGDHREPGWYEGDWVLYESGADMVPQELCRFRAPQAEGSAGVSVTVDVSMKPSPRLSLTMDWGEVRQELRVEDVCLAGEEAPPQEASPARDDTEKLILELLPIVDSLEYGVRYIRPEDEGPHAQGLRRILRQAKDTLEKLEVTEIPALGRPFDSALHNAVVQVPDGTLPPNTVREVVHTGYLYRGRILRYADVIVSG